MIRTPGVAMLSSIKKFIKNQIKSDGIKSSIILLIASLVILAILPNHTIDPWDLFNPRNFWLLIITIGTIQFGGYLAIHLFGERFGVAITGFLGGLVSSTAVFANLPHMLESHPKFNLAIIASAILATLAMLVEVISIIFVASPILLLYIIRPILVMAIVSILLAITLLHFQKLKGHKSKSPANPFNLLAILRTSIFIGLTLAVIAIAKRFIGTEGLLLISFLGGLFEIHGISLATSLLYLDHHLSITIACSALFIAILASFVSKLFLLWTLTPIRFAIQTSLLLLIIIASGTITYMLTY